MQVVAERGDTGDDKGQRATGDKEGKAWSEGGWGKACPYSASCLKTINAID